MDSIEIITSEKQAMEEDKLGCSLYTDATVELEELIANLASLLNASVKGLYVENAEGYICVDKNDEFDEQMRRDGEDGFLYYRYLIEVEPNKELGEENAVAFVSKILRYLWSEDYPATAACAYEDALPNKGKLIPENHSWNEYYIWK